MLDNTYATPFDFRSSYLLIFLVEQKRYQYEWENILEILEIHWSIYLSI